LQWIWHQPGADYSPVDVERSKRRRTVARGGEGRRGRRRGKANRESEDGEADKVEEVIYVLTDDEDKVIALNSTQSVVVAHINLLPKPTYHVFVDNLFSSPGLLLSFCQHGHGATGTACLTCGTFKKLADYKKKDISEKSGLKFNEIGVIPTPDNQVGAFDIFSCVSLIEICRCSRTPRS
jgi:hypothetical protein